MKARTVVFLFIAMLAASSWSQTRQSQRSTQHPNQNFDGKWWLGVGEEERSGFLNGAADCLTWEAKEKGFNATPEELTGRITKFYRMHPKSANAPVIDVWQQIANESASSGSTDTQGETWTNAHWYLNGLWWRQESDPERLGFLEGYLWCMSARVHSDTDTYSKSPPSYKVKIDAYVKDNPKSDDEAIAVILSQFRDSSTGAK
jgi:hypothetical protein